MSNRTLQCVTFSSSKEKELLLSGTPITRRDMLVRSLLLLGAVSVGGGTKHLFETEIPNDQSFTIPSSALYTLARQNVENRKDKRFLFGFQGVETENDKRIARQHVVIDQAEKEIGRMDCVGVFATIDDFRSPERTEKILTQVYVIYAQGKIPMLNVGYGDLKYEVNPFDPIYRDDIKAALEHMFKLLSTLHFHHYIRLCYEWNGKWFTYGRGNMIRNSEHEEAIRWIFAHASQLCNEYQHLIFSPNAGEPIIPYVPFVGVETESVSANFSSTVDHLLNAFSVWEQQDEILTYVKTRQLELRMHMNTLEKKKDPVALQQQKIKIAFTSLDGYNFHPGKGKFLEPGYWLQENQSAASVFLFSILDLMISMPQIPYLISEAGVMSMNPQELQSMLLLAISMGAVGFMPFVINKEQKSIVEKIKNLHERNWEPTPEIVTMFHQTLLKLGLFDSPRYDAWKTDNSLNA